MEYSNRKYSSKIDIDSIKRAVRGARKVQADIENALRYMDFHLDGLSDAKGRGSESGASFHRQRLEMVRKLLVELEYFPSISKEEYVEQ